LTLLGNRIGSISKDALKSNTNLQEIRLAGNRISTIIEHAFPSSLLLLDLVNNQITSISNGSFANLAQLEKLYLNNNPLQRVEPGAFNALKNLTELHMDSSKLFTLPVLKNLPKLTNLSISYSLFTSTKLVTTTDSSYGGKTEMETENTNFYSGTTPKEDHLAFDEESSPGIDTTVRYFQRARHSLDEDDDPGKKYNAQDSSQEELIGDLMALKKLVLINDDLKTLNWLGYLPNLTDLIMSRNEIKLIPQGFFSNMPSVKHIDLSKNAISDLSDLNANNLAYLDLSNNFIRYIDRVHLKNVKQLKILSLSSNRVSEKFM
ncbi:Leucine-rich repeat-containing G-protein coupled receptor 4, partial [Orchesella cincta]